MSNKVIKNKIRPTCKHCGDPMVIAEWICFNVEKHDKKSNIGVSTYAVRCWDDDEDGNPDEFIKERKQNERSG